MTGVPGSERWNPTHQRDVILYLVEAGADPNAAAAGGVTPRLIGAAGTTTRLHADSLPGVVLGTEVARCSDENGSDTTGTLIAVFKPQPEKVIVLDHDCPPSDPWAEYAAGSLERDNRSSRARPVTIRP